MSDKDLGWDELTDAWREPEPLPFDPTGFRSVLRRRTTVTALVALSELGITVGLVWLTIRASASPAIGEDLILLAGLWLFWAVAMTFAWWNRRGQWQRSVASSEEFVRLNSEYTT